MTRPSVPTTPSPVEVTILRAIARYHYLTAAQVQRLYGYARRNYTQARLKGLVDQGVLRVLYQGRFGRGGSSAYVYRLSTRGRRALLRLGFPVPPGRRPSEEHRLTDPFLRHTLAINDVLISAALLEQQLDDVVLQAVLHERELRRSPAKLNLPSGQTTRYVSDGWLDLTYRGYRYPLALEVQRSAVEQRRWRAKVAKLIAWVQGPYQAQFETQSLRILVVVPPDAEEPPARLAAKLRLWTERELTAQEATRLSLLFAFSWRPAAQLPPTEFFCSRHWELPFATAPVALLEVGSG